METITKIERSAQFIDNYAYLPQILFSHSMQITLLKAKRHRATVTNSELGYEGSCAIDSDILDLAGIREYEQIQIYNVNNGARFTTYAIRAQAGSKTFSVNGAAARLACVGDLMIICTYAQYDSEEARSHHPTLVYFDNQNNVMRTASKIPVQVS